jgi:PPOX class probable F420-dependent enzyme
MPELDPEEARLRFSAGRVAYLATVRADGRPHLVPIVFAADGGRLYSIADPKPKRGLDLLRHRNIAANPAVSLLVDAYDEAWERLWWARADGQARVVSNGPEREAAISMLRDKYAQYTEWAAPFGAATIIDVDRWSGWAMAGGE